jgi:hypothetical protein
VIWVPHLRRGDIAPKVGIERRETVHFPFHIAAAYHNPMAFPIKICIVCEEEFELKPDKPGFANRCPTCSAPESNDSETGNSMDADERKSLAEANEARRAAIRELLYTRK